MYGISVRGTVAALMVALLGTAGSFAQDAPSAPTLDQAAPPDQNGAPPPGPDQAPPAPARQYTPGELDQLVAPIALYPDPLIAQILMAATYPLEVVEADRWIQDPQNASLKGSALQSAVEQEPWDPSVKSLVQFPRVLRMMDNDLDWMERLGDAFLADQAAVMDSVQRLRHRAQAAGKLDTTSQMVVSQAGPAIEIEPAAPDVVYVPVYDPNVVYGPWPYPDYPPFYFPGFFDDAFFGPLGFGWVNVVVIAPFWGWCHWDWHHHHIDIDHDRFANLNNRRPSPGGDVWQHDPGHRRGVGYRDPAVRARFAGRTAAAPEMRPVFHGNTQERAPQARPEPSGRPAPAFHPAPGNAPAEGARPAPHAAPAPEFRPAPAVRPAPAYRPAQQQNYRAPPQHFAPPIESFGRGPDIRVQTQPGVASRVPAPSFARPSGGAPHVAPSAPPSGGASHAAPAPSPRNRG